MRKLKFEIHVQEADLITQALGELPYKLVADLITNLRCQAAPQLQEMINAEQKSLEAESAVPRDPSTGDQSAQTEESIRPEDGDERD